VIFGRNSLLAFAWHSAGADLIDRSAPARGSVRLGFFSGRRQTEAANCISTLNFGDRDRSLRDDAIPRWFSGRKAGRRQELYRLHLVTKSYKPLVSKRAYKISVEDKASHSCAMSAASSMIIGSPSGVYGPSASEGRRDKRMCRSNPGVDDADHGSIARRWGNSGDVVFDPLMLAQPILAMLEECFDATVRGANLADRAIQAANER
jgi:hypothetical protein